MKVYIGLDGSAGIVKTVVVILFFVFLFLYDKGVV